MELKLNFQSEVILKYNEKVRYFLQKRENNAFSMKYRNSIDARLSGLHLKPNRSPAQRVRFGKEEQQNERTLTFEKSRSKRYTACSDVEYRNTIDANWAKDEDSAFTNLYLDLQLIPTRRFRLAQPKDPKGV